MARTLDRICCAIDLSGESFEAAQQVTALSPRTAKIDLVTIVQHVGAVPPGFGVATAPLLRARRDAQEALELAETRLGRLRPTTATLLEGTPIPALLRHLEEEGATLVSVGIHHESRAVGVALGSVATAMLHDAPCAVYVGRARLAAPGTPATVAAGVDGSPEAGEALETARGIARRTGARLVAVVARGGKHVHADEIARGLRRRRSLDLVIDDRSPVDALVDSGADLIVLGSRGLHGVHALGSISERVAHRAHCPVLVVRDRVGPSPAP